MVSSEERSGRCTTHISRHSRETTLSRKGDIRAQKESLFSGSARIISSVIPDANLNYIHTVQCSMSDTGREKRGLSSGASSDGDHKKKRLDEERSDSGCSEFSLGGDSDALFFGDDREPRQ